MFKYPCRSAVSDITQFLGRLVHNSQCHYKLDNCSQRKCLVRSPHYPGMYPRNLTCSYHVFVLPSEIPSGKQVSYSAEPKSLKTGLEQISISKTEMILFYKASNETDSIFSIYRSKFAQGWKLINKILKQRYWDGPLNIAV